VAFSTVAQARAYDTKLLKEIAGRTVSDAVQEFVVEQRESGLRSGTVKVAEFRLRAFFQLDAEVDGRTMPYAETGGLLESLQPQGCGPQLAGGHARALHRRRDGATRADPARDRQGGAGSGAARGGEDLPPRRAPRPRARSPSVPRQANRVGSARCGYRQADEPAPPVGRSDAVSVKLTGPMLRVLSSEATSAAAEPTSSAGHVGNGQ
jgi:hypothetical protein